MATTPTPTPTQQQIIDLILQERARQDLRWGGPGFDDTQGIEDWIAYIQRYLDKLNSPTCVGPDETRRLVQIAALCLAAVESMSRPNSATYQPKP